MFLFLIFLLLPTFACGDNSLTCTLCQLASNFMYKENTTITGGINIAELREQCKQFSDCHHTMTDCELVAHLSSFPLTDEQSEKYKSFLFVTRLLTARCMFEPDSDVIEDFQLPFLLMCDICKLLYKQFGKINNGLHGKDVNLVLGFVKLICFVSNIKFDPPPKICQLIAIDGESIAIEALDAILRGIEDSLEPFYNVAGKPFGCPPYDTLFDYCRN